MKILSAENSVSYTANNACKIYIIKQEAYENKLKFEQDYASLLGDATKLDKFISTNNVAITSNRNIKLVPLISFNYINSLYTHYDINETIDRPIFNVLGESYKPQDLYFLTSLLELKNCPLIDFSKLAYVFQIDGQSAGGLANVISFTTNFSVNGQSSAELVINNKDFKYNFKYFNDPELYNKHLKCYFDTNDIIIIRYQKKNIVQDSLLESFKKRNINYWKDPYINSENDSFTTVFTGYINDINSSFSFNNGQQTLTLSCTGPSKKLTWTRVVTNQAAASKDASSAILPLSAFQNPQTRGDNGQTTINNNNVIKNLVCRVFSGVLNIVGIKNAYNVFEKYFDIYNNPLTDEELRNLKNEINKLEKIKNRSIKQTKQLENKRKQYSDRISEIREIINSAKNAYNYGIDKYKDKFVKQDDEDGTIKIQKNTFIENLPYIFEIQGTNQPAYKYEFNSFANLFQSDFSTAYQFIKGIADNLQFNFYDDPWGTIHFSVPTMSLSHLHNSNNPNRLNQIVSFSESQNTENIANIQFASAQYIFGSVDLSPINTIIKDYLSVKKYGEKMMQPFQMPGLINPEAIKYAAKMRMAKYNRKALSNIRVSMNGEPSLLLDRYAYIQSLRKLFYVESYSHSYNAGGDFTTSLNGTFTRDILAYADGSSINTTNFNEVLTEKQKDNLNIKKSQNITLNMMLSNATSSKMIADILSQIDFISLNDEAFKNKIYNIYVQNWNYPENNYDLKEEIGAMYSKDNIKECYLDNFFWALPFDVDPYKIALQIQEEEKQKTKTLNNTLKSKKTYYVNAIKGKKTNITQIVENPNKIPFDSKNRQVFEKRADAYITFSYVSNNESKK